jgi:molybdate transport system permease protein
MFSLSPEEIEVLQLSLRVALWSVWISLPFGIAVAYLLARTNFPGKSLFDALVHLPLILPPVVVGYMLLMLLGRRGPLGSLLEQYFGIVVAFRWTGAAIASAIMGFPLLVRAIRLSLELAAGRRRGTLGAGWGGFSHHPLPVLPGVITGCCRSRATWGVGACPLSPTSRARRAPATAGIAIIMTGDLQASEHPFHRAFPHR